MPGLNEDVAREVEQFLYREARLLDERRFHDWLELLTDDIRYWMAGRSNRYPNRVRRSRFLTPIAMTKTTWSRRTNWRSSTKTATA